MVRAMDRARTPRVLMNGLLPGIPAARVLNLKIGNGMGLADASPGPVYRKKRDRREPGPRAAR